MADYIDRAEAIKALREFGETCKGSSEAATAVSVAISVLSRVPSRVPSPQNDVVPARHGHWLNWSDFFQRETDKRLKLGVFCSACRMYADNKVNYCPNCGAKMDGGGQS